ncbi:type IV secretion system protein [Paraburkholderia atlantica]|uniref:type IV secretion system protein n=1 Tax=Paraburkholderia atlantica TaxID=2654982 RepID=UPI00161679D5|nr:type IV secretion system protein [Paraburkholderia atlantica]MBB5511072.1 hypothetical protein [Paraburkholderia atlantica]
MTLRNLKHMAIAWLIALLTLNTSPALADASASAPVSASGTAANPYVSQGETAAGNARAIDKITAMFSSIMDTAVSASQSIQQESDKFASGLAVITIVLAAVRFGATKDPVMAWVALFEELGILGIFASIYVGFASWAPNFYKWFVSMANDIGGANMTSALSIMGSAAGQVFDSAVQAWSGIGFKLTMIPDVVIATIPLFFAWALLSVTSIIFVFFINIGQLQFAAGVVMGQIAFALGFSSFTRGYFKSWLDYMVSAGMYIVVAAILMRLVTHNMVNAVQDAAQLGLTTAGAAAQVFDLAFFVFLVSFEIPKIAGMFGGGANASGAIIGKIAKTATGGLV